MEFQFNIKNVATEEMLKVDNTLMAVGHEENSE
jgi:hypothetical protein